MIGVPHAVRHAALQRADRAKIDDDRDDEYVGENNYVANFHSMGAYARYKEQTPLVSCNLRRYTHLLSSKFEDVYILSVEHGSHIAQKAISRRRADHFLSPEDVEGKRLVMFSSTLRMALDISVLRHAYWRGDVL